MNPLTFPLDLAFFGRSKENAAQHRLNLFSQINEIVFHGKGGYTFSDVYNMPTWLRKFTYHEIKEFYEKKNSENEPKNNAINSDGTINKNSSIQQNKPIPISMPGVVPKSKPTTYK